MNKTQGRQDVSGELFVTDDKTEINLMALWTLRMLA